MDRRFRPFYIGALAITGLGLLGSLFVPKAHADAWDKKTVVTINEPVIAGNKVLNPGTYVWKLLDSQSNRHIVQIFDKDQKHLEETILAIPNERLQPTGDTRFTFWETPAGVPKAVRAWFYPGDNFGQEFAYPKKFVAQLASAVPVPVSANYHEPEPAAQAAPAAETAPQAAGEPAVASPQPEPAAPVAEAPSMQQAAPAEPAPTSLPHTASASPIIGLLGLAALGLAGMLSITAKKA